MRDVLESGTLPRAGRWCSPATCSARWSRPARTWSSCTWGLASGRRAGERDHRRRGGAGRGDPAGRSCRTEVLRGLARDRARRAASGRRGPRASRRRGRLGHRGFALVGAGIPVDRIAANRRLEDAFPVADRAAAAGPRGGREPRSQPDRRAPDECPVPAVFVPGARRRPFRCLNPVIARLVLVPATVPGPGQRTRLQPAPYPAPDRRGDPPVPAAADAGGVCHPPGPAVDPGRRVRGQRAGLARQRDAGPGHRRDAGRPQFRRVHFLRIGQLSPAWSSPWRCSAGIPAGHRGQLVIAAVPAGRARAAVPAAAAEAGRRAGLLRRRGCLPARHGPARLRTVRVRLAPAAAARLGGGSWPPEACSAGWPSSWPTS